VLTFRQKQPTTCLGLVVFALCALGFFAQPSLAAENCTAPPGTSGLDQYCESIPGAGGTNSHHNNGGGGGAKHVSRNTTKALKSKGADGAAVLSLAQTGSATVQADTTPPASTKKKAAAVHHRATHHKKGGATPSSGSSSPAAPQHVAAGPAAPAAPSNNPLSAVGSAVGGNSAYTWVIIGLGALLAALALGARRRSSGGEAAAESSST
jgi:hypothetical protein